MRKELIHMIHLHEKKLTDYSKQFLRNQIKYKEKLDAIIVYVNKNYDKK